MQDFDVNNNAAEQQNEPVAANQPSNVVFRNFREACEWSRENAGRAFRRCGDGECFQPVPEADALQAIQSWHEFEELYLDGPYRNEMS